MSESARPRWRVMQSPHGAVRRGGAHGFAWLVRRVGEAAHTAMRVEWWPARRTWSVTWPAW